MLKRYTSFENKSMKKQIEEDEIPPIGTKAIYYETLIWLGGLYPSIKGYKSMAILPFVWYIITNIKKALHP